MTNAFIDSVKVMARGQITIPKNVRNILGISVGERLMLVVEGDSIRLLSSTPVVEKLLQIQMTDAAEFNSEEDVNNLVKEVGKDR